MLFPPIDDDGMFLGTVEQALQFFQYIRGRKKAKFGLHSLDMNLA